MWAIGRHDPIRLRKATGESSTVGQLADQVVVTSGALEVAAVVRLDDDESGRIFDHERDGRTFVSGFRMAEGLAGREIRVGGPAPQVLMAVDGSTLGGPLLGVRPR